MRDGEWHHIAATKSGGAAALYVDGELIHSAASGAGSQPAVGPWHVMRNGTNAVFSGGEADEVALYTRALGADEIGAHSTWRGHRGDATAGRAATARGRAAAGGHRPGGGVLGPASPLPTPMPRPGVVLLRRGALIARGAPGRRNNLVARRRGGNWFVRDQLARLRAGAAAGDAAPAW